MEALGCNEREKSYSDSDKVAPRMSNQAGYRLCDEPALARRWKPTRTACKPIMIGLVCSCEMDGAREVKGLRPGSHRVESSLDA